MVLKDDKDGFVYKMVDLIVIIFFILLLISLL